MRAALLPIILAFPFSLPVMAQDVSILSQTELVSLCLTDDTGTCATSIDSYFGSYSDEEVDPAVGAFVDELTAYAVLCEEPPADPNAQIAAAIRLAAAYSSNSELVFSIAETVDACQIEGTASIGAEATVPSPA